MVRASTVIPPTGQLTCCIRAAGMFLRTCATERRQEAEEADQRQTEDVGNDPVSALSGDGPGEGDSTDNLDWMKLAGRFVCPEAQAAPDSHCSHGI